MNTGNGFNTAEDLVNRYLNDVLRLALVYVRNMEDAEDVSQQVFITYLQKSPVFESEEHAKNWLSKVTVNLSKNFLRSKRNEVNFDELEGVLSTEDTVVDTKTEREERVFKAVMSLKPSYREVIHLYYYSGYDTNEIAKILTLPASSVRSRLARARAALKTILEGGESIERGLQECNEQN